MDLSEVKACLRALLSSSPICYTLSPLLNDFRTTTGFDLPLFGYSNPVDFLCSMTDTVQLHGDIYNPVVALVGSEKSSHIISLVERQRNRKINNSSNTNFPPRLMKSSMHNRANNASGCCFPAAGSYFPNMQRNFQTDYRQRGSNSINIGNYNGFRKNNLNSPNTSKIYPRYEPSLGGSANVSKDQQQHDSQVFEKIPERNLETEAVSNNTPNEFPEFSKPLTTTEQPDNTQSVSETPQNDSKEIEKIDSCYFEGEIQEFRYEVFGDFSDNDSFVSEDNSKTSPLKTDIYVNDGMKNKLQQLIKKFPDGLWCCDLPGYFFEEYNNVLDYREFGCTSLIEMLAALPDVFRCIRPGNEDWVLLDASIPPSEEKKKVIKLQESRNATSDIASNLQKLLLDHSENSSSKGVELTEIQNLYETMFDTSLDFQSMGFPSLNSLLETYDGSLLNICNTDEKVMVVPIVDKDTQGLEWKEALPPITKDNDIFKEIFPDDVVGPEGSYPQLDLSLHVAVGHRVEVCVAEVWSPGEFCVQLNKFRIRWSRFAAELQKFYNTHLNKYKMPDATIVPQQLCVGLYSEDPENPDEWNRAKVLKVINEKIVMVEFVDFGTVARVKKRQLRFLHRSFHSLPVQAFAAELYNLAPKNDDIWSMKASKTFLELSRVSHLEAELMDIDFEKPLLKVVLYDPSHNPHLNINQELISDDLAKEVNKENGVYAPFPKEPENQKIITSEKGVEKKTFSVASDEFSDVSDLEYHNNGTQLFHFKMKSDTGGDFKSSSEIVNAENTKKIFDEFEEVPDWEKIFEKEEEEKVAIKQISKEPDLFDIKEDIPLPNSDPSPDGINSVTLEKNVLEIRTTRVPPGLERMVELNRCRMLPVEQPEEIKKKINIVTIELLTTNPSIKQVALRDPSLALKIASEMAEVYIRWMCYDINPFGNSNFSATMMPEPSFLLPLPPPFPDAFRPTSCDSSSNPQILVKNDTSVTTVIKEVPSTAGVKPIRSTNNNGKTYKYIRVETIGGRNIHVTTLNGKAYFFAEELIRTFSTFNNRDVADRVLHLKKILVEYKILNKTNGEKILAEIKSFEIPGVFKKKSKKWNVYLLPSETVIKYLQGLGCDTKSFESDFINFEKMSKDFETETTQQI